MRLIISEKQMLNIIDLIVTEQTANIVGAGTDARKVSHAYLTKNYGLPEGKEHENFLYSATTENIINQSRDKTPNKYLSVFRPYSGYSQNSNDYLDYVRINDDVLTQASINQRVNRVFPFETGFVIASHNGLLGIARAMDKLNGVGGTINLQFGQSKTGGEAQSERFSSVTNYNSEAALNRGPLLNTIYTYLAIASISPKNRELTSFGKGMVNWDNDTLINRIKILSNNLVMGVGGFIDPNNMDLQQIISSLKPKKYITTVDFDVTPFVNELTKLQSIEDLQNGTYNTDKQQMVSDIGDKFINRFVTTMKNTYVYNFNIFVRTYLTDDQNRILSTINQLKFPAENLGIRHKFLFQSRPETSRPSAQSTMTTGKTNYKQ